MLEQNQLMLEINQLLLETPVLEVKEQNQFQNHTLQIE